MRSPPTTRALPAALLLLAALLLAGAAGPAVAAQPDEGEDATSVGGTVRAEGDGVPGVRLFAELDGEQVAETRTAGDGTWRLELPGAGRYRVTLDVDTLPEGTALRNPDRNPLEVDLRAGQHRALLFPLGERAAAGRGTLDRALDLGVQGIKLGAIIALAAIGLSLIFGITGLVNFAHGEMVTFGAAVAFLVNVSAVGPRWHLLVAAPIAVVAGGLFGYALERGCFRPLRRRRTGLIALIVVTIGMSLFIRHVLLILLGGQRRTFADYAVQRAASFGPVNIAPKDVVIIVLALAVLVAVGLALQLTRTGTAMRAVADNQALAAASGIDVERVILVTWIAGGALAALGGVLYGVTESVSWDMGFRLLLVMFAAVILGGLGTAYGAMAGGLLIGVVSEVSVVWFPVDFKLVFVFLALILTLLVRPQGILGIRERIG